MRQNSACVWARGHKGFLGKYYILYNKFQWRLCSPLAGGWRQPSVLGSLPGICWHLKQPFFGCTQELSNSPQGGESWLGHTEGDISLAGLLHSLCQRGCGKPEEAAALLLCLHHSPAARKAGPPCCQRWMLVPLPLSFPLVYSGERKLQKKKKKSTLCLKGQMKASLWKIGPLGMNLIERHCTRGHGGVRRCQGTCTKQSLPLYTCLECPSKNGK